MTATLLHEVKDWLRIPSISTGEGDPADLLRAARWAAERIEGAGGRTQILEPAGGNPLLVGELDGPTGTPTVLIYGHYDVQGPGELDRWTSPPFEPEIRDGRLFARGAADDKGNFLPLLHVACELARSGRLPLGVRVLLEGEEEVGGHSVSDWLRADERGADAAIVFDSGMADERTPAITIGLRGIVQLHVTLRTGVRPLHSGLYGGTARNALHELIGLLAPLRAGPDGRLRAELREGVRPPDPVEVASWERLPAGATMLAEAGAVPLDDRAASEFYLRTGAEPALDVNAIAGGEPRTVIPASATATVTMRLAAGQSAERMDATLRELIAGAAPSGVSVELHGLCAEPVLFQAGGPVIELAAGALERACGVAPVLARSGGSIPVVADMAARGLPTIVSGFSLPEDAFHAPDESYSLRSLELGEAASHELYAALATL
ncbi:MAG TPA: M20/M25/M40 family metallo-hydrolase [Solirubrobacteraceae bacterium]|nr:M20/M25/M40 family metallo-hydrolase [Solirubrobacteraceae bacterium]